MRGNRKVLVFAVVALGLVGGLTLTKDAGIYSVFAASLVGAGGWFFRANIEEHKAKP